MDRAHILKFFFHVKHERMIINSIATMDLNATVQLRIPEGQTWPFSTCIHVQDFIRTPANEIIIIIQHNIWKSGIIPVPLHPANHLLFMIAGNILNLAYFELNFPTERSEPMLKIKIYHLHRSE